MPASSGAERTKTESSEQPSGHATLVASADTPPPQPSKPPPRYRTATVRKRLDSAQGTILSSAASPNPACNRTPVPATECEPYIQPDQ